MPSSTARTSSPFLAGARLGWWLALSLSLSIATHAVLRNLGAAALDESTAAGAEAATIGRLSAGIRRTVARWLLVRTDFYAHSEAVALTIGPAEKSQRVASYRWSREIIPALRLAIMFDPHLTDALTILGPHLAKDFGHLDEGVRVLQAAVLGQREHPLVFRLYGEIATIYQHFRRWPQAARYFERALVVYPRILDEALMGRYSLEAESQDLFYNRSYAARLTECAFRASDFKRALWGMDRWESLDPTNRFVSFLLQYRANPAIAIGFDPDTYLSGFAKTTPVLPTPKAEEIGPRKVVVSQPRPTYTIGFEREFQAKLIAMALIPLVFCAYALALRLAGRRVLWGY